jgi:hypothetical protein
MNNIYVGIDPSVNSTGVCISVYDDNDNLLEEKFYIVKPDKLTKKEDAAESKHISKFAFCYMIKNLPIQTIILIMNVIKL